MKSNRDGNSMFPGILGALAGLLVISPLNAGEGPFFITYTHQMEEPRNLELATKNVTGRPRDGDRFLGSTTELEYGVRAWWTTDLYFDGQDTRDKGVSFTRYR